MNSNIFETPTYQGLTGLNPQKLSSEQEAQLRSEVLYDALRLLQSRADPGCIANGSLNPAESKVFRTMQEFDRAVSKGLIKVKLKAKQFHSFYS